MKSFADWTQSIAEANNHEPEPKRYYGMDFAAPGTESHQHYGGAWWSDGKKAYVAYCVCCGNLSEVYCDDMKDFDHNNHYCGASPRCCP